MQFKLNDIKNVTVPAVTKKDDYDLDTISYELLKKEFNNSLMETHKEFVFFIDRSGSMFGTEYFMEKYFSDMINKYKNTNEDILVTVVLFESEDHVLFYRKPIQKINSLNYVADGGTKLYDTVVSNISNILNDQFKNNSLAYKTLVTILTDGDDTSSKRYKESDLKGIIEYTKKLGWEYILLCECNLNMNIGIDKIGIYDDKNRLGSCFESINKAIESFIETDRVSEDWNESLTSGKKLLLTKKGE